MMFCGLCEILSDEFDPGEWGSADMALVRGHVELQGFLCRSVFVQTKDDRRLLLILSMMGTSFVML